MREQLGYYKWLMISQAIHNFHSIRGIMSGFRLRSYNLTDTILLAGSPRSGTTWLGNVICQSKGFAQITEPFHLGVPGRERAGFSWCNYYHPDTNWPAGERIIKEVFQGKNLKGGMLRENTFSQLVTCRALLIKCVRQNRLLPWIGRRFNIKGIVVIVRHPCAVVASQMAHPLFPSYYELPPWDRHYIEENLPSLLPFAKSLKTEEELRALNWCLDQHTTLGSPYSDKWIRVSQEKLVIDGKAELGRVFSALDIPLTEECIKMLSMTINGVKNWSVNHSRASTEERLSGWVRKLNYGQIERILSVVKTCGIRGFSDQVIPDFDNIGVVKREFLTLNSWPVI